MNDLEIRPFQPADLDAIYRICLLTGSLGQDASAHYADPRLLGDFYAIPYVRQDPGLCLIATLDGAQSGYVLGTADSTGFHWWTEHHWLPTLRERHPLPNAADTSANAILLRRVHAGHQPPHYSGEYPAHLHIDLLPCLQGRGVGATLMRRFLELLRQRGCPAVHLVVNAANERAVAFYDKIGFHLVERSPNHCVFGFKLG